MALTFERRGSTWACFDPAWDLLLVARNLYHGTDRLLGTMTLARSVDGVANLTIETERLDLLTARRCRDFAKECAHRLAPSSKEDGVGLEIGILSMLDGMREHLLLIHGQIEAYDLLDIKVPADLTPRYALWPFVPSSRPGMVVGPSGQGKSGFAAFGGLSVVTGKALLPRIDPKIQGPVLYIGQEEDKEQWAARLHQMCRGHGIEVPKYYTYLRLASGSLIDSAELVAELAAVRHAVLIIVDSAQATWGNESESVRGYASSWFNAIDQLGVPTLIVEHPNRGDTGKPTPGGFAAGSSVKRDRVGHSWNLKSVEMPVRPDEPLRYHVTLSDTKRNYVARQQDITYETLIHGHEWIRFVEAGEMSAETIVNYSSKVDELVAAKMRTDGGDWTNAQIVKAIEKDDRDVRRSLLSDHWRESRWDPDLQYKFEKVPGTGEPYGSRTNPAKYRLVTQRAGGVQMSMLPGDPDEVQ